MMLHQKRKTKKYLMCIFLVVACRTAECKEPPKITPLNFNPMVYVGGKASVACVSGGETPIKFSWLHKHKEIMHGSSKVEVSSLKDASILTIEPVSLDDAGDYTCYAKNAFGNDSATATLVVEAPLRWLREPTDVEATEGFEIELVCGASGSPEPHYTWTKTKDNDSEKKMVMKSADGHLIFKEVKVSDAGTYTCRVHNGVGESLEKSATVVVYGERPLTFTFTSLMICRKERMPKWGVLSPKGTPPLSFRWFWNNIEIQDGSEFQISTQAGVSVLVVKHLSGSSTGNFTCQATNAAGKDAHTAPLVVNGSFPLLVRNGSLHFDPLSVEHEGEYACEARNSHGLILRKIITLSVVGK